MQVHHDIHHLPAFRNAVVTIGTFDGVHLGHQRILAQLKAEALAIKGETVIITFHPHPRAVVGGKQPVPLITTIDEKLHLLAASGIDHTVVVPFTEEFAEQTAESYIVHFLVGKFHPHTVIIGYDHRFGLERKGDYKLMERYSELLGFSLKEIPARLVQESTVSSTRIREALLNGDVALARSLLGYDFFFTGVVVHGDQLGRELGYPTANLEMTDAGKLVPGNGIYVVEASLDGGSHLKAMMSIGTRPTVNGKDRKIEVNILDFKEDIYDKQLQVFVKKYLRPELRFDSLEALKTQIDLDKVHTIEYFAE